MQIRSLYNYIDEIAPFKSAYSWDNVGLLVGDLDAAVHRVLVCMDVTPHVVDEAERMAADLILSHHPVIFKGEKSFTTDSVCYQCAKLNVSVISAHTNLDRSPVGINYALANALGLQGLTPLLQEEQQYGLTLNCYIGNRYLARSLEMIAERRDLTNQPYVSKAEDDHSLISIDILPSQLDDLHNMLRFFGDCKVHTNQVPLSSYDIGLKGNLPKALTPRELAQKIAEATGLPPRFNNNHTLITEVGVCGGSGYDIYVAAVKQGARLDAFVSSEIKHDRYIAAQNDGVTLFDAGHHASEMLGMHHLIELLQGQFANVEFRVASSYAGELTTV